MTLNAYFLEKPTCRRESWLIKSTYPQNIQRTSAILVNKRSRGRRLPGAAPVEKWDQTACKPGSVPPGAAKRRALAIIPLDRPSRDGSRDLPGPLGPTTALPPVLRAHGPYSVLLLAGLAMPSLLPGTRWALTPPFHPSHSGERRFAFCGAIPGVAPGGRYPPPCRRGARTFLDPLAEAATAQPSDPRGT